MATFHRADNDVGWFALTHGELETLTGNPFPICDECLATLAANEDAVLVPILNEAFCQKCARTVLGGMKPLSEHDLPIERKRIDLYRDSFDQRKSPRG